MQHVIAWYSSDWCSCLYKISKFHLIWNFYFDLLEIRSSDHCHYSPGFWPLDHRWHGDIGETWPCMVWPRYTPLSRTPLPGVSAVPAAQPQPLNPILKIISVKRSSSLYQSFFDSRKLVLLGNKSLFNYSKCTSAKRWLAFDIYLCIVLSLRDFQLDWKSRRLLAA